MRSESTQQGEPAEVSTNVGRLPMPNQPGRLGQRVSALVLSILLLTAGIALFVLDHTAIFAPCQASDLTCPAWWEAPAFDIGVFAWAIGGIAVDGVRGRPYGRWLTAAVGLLSVYLLVALVTRGGL
jgi:hypothetical protein